MNVEQLWEKHGTKGLHEGNPNVPDTMGRFRFELACADLLSSQWQTREPTREDGDDEGKIMVRFKYSGANYYSHEVYYIHEWSGDEWMRIPK